MSSLFREKVKIPLQINQTGPQRKAYLRTGPGLSSVIGYQPRMNRSQMISTINQKNSFMEILLPRRFYIGIFIIARDPAMSTFIL